MRTSYAYPAYVPNTLKLRLPTLLRLPSMRTLSVLSMRMYTVHNHVDRSHFTKSSRSCFLILLLFLFSFPLDFLSDVTRYPLLFSAGLFDDCHTFGLTRPRCIVIICLETPLYATTHLVIAPVSNHERAAA